MRHINDDIGDLFQKAAEEYPLRTGTPDWKAVQDKLFLQNAIGKNRFNGSLTLSFQKSAVLILLTVIPLSTALNGLIHHSGSAEKDVLTNKGIAISASTALSENKFNSVIQVKEKQALPLNFIVGNSDFTNIPGKAIFDANIVTNLHDHFANDDTYKQDEQSFNRSKIPNDDNALIFNDIIAEDIVSTVSPSSKNTVISLAQSLDDPLTIKIKSTRAKASNFYAGVFAESELTNVKGQSFRKPGFNGGFLLGYDLNKRIQAEIGLVFSRKYYYSDGKYAAPNSLRQDGLPIGGVNIYSKITEIPLTLRYNFKNTMDNKLFAATGGVMNIVNQEKYNYRYTKDGRAKKGFKQYNESVGNLFSNIQVSIGYEHKLGNVGYMRVEPYYRIPLNGIGTGNLPVTSVGLNLGLIKHFK